MATRVFSRQAWCVFAYSLSLLLSQSSGHNILVNAILGKGSHFHLSAAISEQLVKRGYNVTYLAELWLVNSDFAGDYPCTLSPNVIPVGGLTTRDPRPLPPDLEDFVQGSGHHGVIVCSFGSFLNMTDDHILRAFTSFSRVFGRLPQRVVWQVVSELSFPIPPNVKTLPWLPLNDLLGHPKTKALFYHGGLNTYYEAIYHAVPTLTVPVYGDQMANAMRSVHLGFGVTISKDFTEDELYIALRTIITNGSYSETARRISGIFRDRPMRPAQRAAFWIDHVIKHSADHLETT
ncbi:UDP-glucuronosyltransferase 2B37-like [Diadema antillarum]|uniref:UDP-glucuronosyltransferase 2B37-like n=1 Tax=Diadema antillarum TaxID=105358 RepID=UPI003A8405D1